MKLVLPAPTPVTIVKVGLQLEQSGKSQLGKKVDILQYYLEQSGNYNVISKCNGIINNRLTSQLGKKVETDRKLVSRKCWWIM